MALHPTAAQSLFIERKIPLRRFIVYSVIGHVLLGGSLIAYNALVMPAAIDLNQKPITATLVRLGQKRDEKLLPRKEEELPPPPKAVEAPPPEPQKPPPPPETPTVALPGIKPTEVKKTKVDGAKTGEDRKKALFSAFGKASKTPDHQLEGAADGDAHGNSATQEGPRYLGALTAQVQRNYDLPSTISDQDRVHLVARVMIAIGRAGELLSVKLVKTSGNDLFDSAIIAAVKRSAPFQPPPDELRGMLSRPGQAVEFRP